MMKLWFLLLLLIVGLSGLSPADCVNPWVIDSTEEWEAACEERKQLALQDGLATPTGDAAEYRSVVHKLDPPRALQSITFSQPQLWQNWEPIPPVGPPELGDAPIFLAIGPNDYWQFGRYRGRANGRRGRQGKDTKAERGTGRGYHAWHSTDMVNWVHCGPVAGDRGKWATTAEHVDGKLYLYYDFPNDQDPHLYIDADMADGKPGRDMGLSFKDPSHGSDCAVIRDLDGTFHIIYEDWSPINAGRHSWDSPLAGHAVSPDGVAGWKILDPAVDERTTPTGKKAAYRHPHWTREDPANWTSDVAEYEVHEPEQNAFGDWAAICVGGQYYLFCDFHPAHEGIRIAWFTSSDIDKPFQRVGEMGSGHPDPDIGFAEGRFYLINQTANDYVSPGPWVEQVEARVGVDTSGNGKIDTWTDWQTVSEKYDYIKGFPKQVKRDPASMDLTGLPIADGVAFAFRVQDKTANAAKPIIDAVTLTGGLAPASSVRDGGASRE